MLPYSNIRGSNFLQWGFWVASVAIVGVSWSKDSYRLLPSIKNNNTVLWTSSFQHSMSLHRMNWENRQKTRVDDCPYTDKCEQCVGTLKCMEIKHKSQVFIRRWTFQALELLLSNAHWPLHVPVKSLYCTVKVTKYNPKRQQGQKVPPKTWL